MTTNKPDFSTACADFKAARLLYWQMSREDAEKLRSYYSAEYDRAEVGWIDQNADAFARFSLDYTPNTAEVVRDYHSNLMRNILRDYVALYTREEIVTMCNLIARGTSSDCARVVLADGVSFALYELVEEYNKAHDEADKITRRAPEHGGIV